MRYVFNGFCYYFVEFIISQFNRHRHLLWEKNLKACIRPFVDLFKNCDKFTHDDSRCSPHFSPVYVKIGYAPFNSLYHPVLDAYVLWVEKMGDRHLEHVENFLFLQLKRRTARQICNERMNVKIARLYVYGGQLADYVYIITADTKLFTHFPKGRLCERDILRFNASARKTDLALMDSYILSAYR